MYRDKTVGVVIPALNEEETIGTVIGRLPAEVDWIVIGDNGSTDSTARVATEAGAIVVKEEHRGYGAACLCALDALKKKSPDIVVFIDGDGSDTPEELPRLLDPIVDGWADFVVGSRMVLPDSRRHLPPAARFGNWLSARIIRMWTGTHFSDLGPFRAIEAAALERLMMADRNFGWTVEMQLKAASIGLRCHEVAVTYAHRAAGESKVSGSVSGSIKAGGKILWTLFRHAGFQEDKSKK